MSDKLTEKQYQALKKRVIAKLRHKNTYLPAVAEENDLNLDWLYKVKNTDSKRAISRPNADWLVKLDKYFKEQ